MASDMDSGTSGKLMTGGIGTLVMGALLLLGNFVGMFAFGLEMPVWAALIYLILAVLSGMGWMGASAIYGGINSVAGIFTFIFAAGVALLVAATFAKSLDLLTIGMYVVAFAPSLVGIFGGIGLMAGAGRGAAGPIKPIAGIVLLVAGIAGIWAGLAVFRVGLPIQDVMGKVASYALPGGFILAGLTKILSRG